MSYIHKQSLVADITKRMMFATNYKEMYEALSAAINEAPEYTELPKEDISNEGIPQD